MPELKKLLKDPEPIVRDAAKTAVRTLAPEEPLPDDPPAAQDVAPAKKDDPRAGKDDTAEKSDSP